MLLTKKMYQDEELVGLLGRLTTLSSECLNVAPRVAQLEDQRLFWHRTRVVEYPWVWKQIKSKAEKILDVGTNIQFWLPMFAMGYDITIHHTSHDLHDMGACSTGVGWASGAHYLRDKPFKAIVGSPPDLDFVKDNSFDTILNVSVMEHVPPPHFEQWLDGLWRILKPGGRMICTCDWPVRLKFGEGVNGSSWFVNHDWRPFIHRTGADVSEAEGVPWLAPEGEDPMNVADIGVFRVSTVHPQKDDSSLLDLSVYGFVLTKPA